MKRTIKTVLVVGAFMLLLVLVTSFFRFVMPPEVEERDEKMAREEAVDPLKGIGEQPEYWQFPGTKGGMGRVFIDRMIVSWFLIILLLIFAFFATRKLSPEKPSRIQALTEVIVGFFNDVCKDTMGKENGRKIFPLVMTLFLFILLSNYAGLIPHFFHFVSTVTALVLSVFDSGIVIIRERMFPAWAIQLPEGHWIEHLARIPKLDEPTADLNTTLGCGLIVITYVHFKAIQSKGFGGYLKSYFRPVFFFFPLNVIGEAAKGVSLSFRLFGNILGGSIVLMVLMTLLYQSGFILINQTVGIYLLLQSFLTVLVGAVQAFVFSMLALTYTAVLSED